MRLASVILGLLLLAPGAIADQMGDLTVALISRLPVIDYVWNAEDPTREGWPEPGQEVTWVAHVHNWFPTSLKGIGYRWLLDGQEIASGTVDLVANGETLVNLQRPWSFERHRLTFEIDTANAVEEQTERNNSLTIFTDALSIGFWVEQSLYDYHRANQWRLGVGSTSFEDWAQRQVAYLNKMCALAIYPETPNGVLDRWRIDKIVVVPDDTLPSYYPGVGQNFGPPDKNDRSVDIQWGFRSTTLPVYQDVETVSPFNYFYIEGSLFHELGHARYLIDVYAWWIRHVPPRWVIDIQENGQPVVGTDLMPGSLLRSSDGDGWQVYQTSEWGMMNQHYTWIDRYSAIVLNQIAHQRATRGNYIAPENFGSFLRDLPAENRLTIRDADGNPIPFAEIRIYQGENIDPDDEYSALYDDVPDRILETDANGQVVLGHNPFTPDGADLTPWKLAQIMAIVRVEKDGVVRYGYLESRLFNLAYWHGHTDLGEYDLTVGGENCSRNAIRPMSPAYAAEHVGSEVTLQWQSDRGARGYTVWASIDGRKPVILGTSRIRSKLDVHIRGHEIYWWVATTYDRCPAERSHTWMFTTDQPPLSHRRAVRRP